jgi:uncharacterized Tic20 family protein
MGMQPTEDERVLAALSHASIVANVVNLAGMIATALIWTMQRDRSAYVRAHALQALVYQGTVLLIAIFMGLFGGVCLALSLLPAVLRPDLYHGSPPGYSVWIGVLALLLLIGFGVVATIYGLYGAYQVYRGRTFRYPLIGQLARSLPVDITGSTPAAASGPAPVAPPAPAAEVGVPSAPPTVQVVPIEPDAAPVAEPLPETPPASSEAPPAPKRRGRRPAGDGEA